MTGRLSKVWLSKCCRGYSAAELFAAYLMLCGNGRKAIMEIWDKKWSKV
jgi:hypothetical protein